MELQSRKRGAKKTKGYQDYPFVLGVGLPRTGTFSLKIALEKLLNIQCYHMIEICGPDVITKRNDHVQFWKDCQDGKYVAKDIIRFLFGHGYRASTDLPVNCFWKDIYLNLDNVKVILSDRDPETWWPSVSATINSWQNQALFKFPAVISLSLCGYKYNLDMSEKCKDIIGVGFEDYKTPEEAVKFYQDWVANVKATVEPEDLLVFRCSEGWQPLCDFLDVPVPNFPFPRANSKDELLECFKSWLKYMYFLFFCLVVWGLVAISFLGYALNSYVL